MTTTAAVSKTVLYRTCSFDVSVERCYKEADGTPHVVGVASDDMQDLTGDRMSDKAVKAMARQCVDNDLPLLDNHRSTFGFGHTHSATTRRVPAVDPQTGKALLDKEGKPKMVTELVVDFALDPRRPESWALYEEVESGQCQKQLSIGGMLNMANRNAVSFEEDKDTGRKVRVINDIELEHIAATRPQRAAVPRTRFVEALVKELFGDESVEATQKALEDGYATAAAAEAARQEMGLVCQGAHSVTVAGQERWMPCQSHGQLQSALSQQNRPDRSLPTPEEKADYTSLEDAQEASRRMGCGGRTHVTNMPDGRRVWRPCADAGELGEAMRRRGGNMGPATPAAAGKSCCAECADGGRCAATHQRDSSQTQERDMETKAENGDAQATETTTTQAGATVTLDPPEATGTDAPAAGTPPEEAPEAAEAAAAGQDNTAGDEGVTNEERELADKAVKRLASIARLFEAPTAEQPSAVVKNLLEAVEAIEGQRLRLSKSDYATVGRIHQALTALLGAPGVAGVNPHTNPDEAVTSKAVPSGDNVTAVDVDAIAQGVLKAIQPSLDALHEGQDAVTKTFHQAFTQMAEKTAEGLEGMAQAFKDYVDGELAKIRASFAGVTETAKEADNRLARLEKAAGVSQRLPGAAADVVQGGPPAAAVEKSRQPDAKNPFRGLFDAAINKQLSRQGRG